MQILQGDCIEVLKSLPDQSVQTCVTSPPYYGLRNYQVDGQIGLEPTPQEYVAKLVSVFREVKRVLRDDGTLWLNLGDSYAGSGCGTNDYRTEKSRSINKSDKMFSKHPPQQKIVSGEIKAKDLLGIPWRVAFALQADGWYLRSDIIWHKPNPMPESVKDRPTKAHEYIFLMAKSQRYYYDAEAIKEESVYPNEDYTNHHKNGGKRLPTEKVSGFRPRETQAIYPTRNKRSVWTVTTKPYREAHFATYPPDLIEPCVLAGCYAGGVVLDPFNGSGTTGYVALKNNRDYIGIELNPEYIELTHKRLATVQPTLEVE